MSIWKRYRQSRLFEPSLVIALLLLVLLAAFAFRGENPKYAEASEAVQKPPEISSPNSGDNRIANYTEALGWFAGILAFATIILCWGAWRLWLEIKKIRADAERALCMLERAYVHIEIRSDNIAEAM